MSVSEKGNLLPKMGRVFPDGAYAVAIASALHQDLGRSHRAIKTVIRWTGASERTVKNWLRGSSGPSGEHLVSLIGHSNDVFQAVLRLAGKEPGVGGRDLIDAHRKLAEVVEILRLKIGADAGAPVV